MAPRPGFKPGIFRLTAGCSVIKATGEGCIQRLGQDLDSPPPGSARGPTVLSHRASSWHQVLYPLSYWGKERARGCEPPASSLARMRSSAELRPHVSAGERARTSGLICVENMLSQLSYARIDQGAGGWPRSQ